MREILKYMVVAIAATIFSSCDSKNEPDIPVIPDENAFTFNKNDSAAFCEILRKAQGEYFDSFLRFENIRLDSIPSWAPYALWRVDTEKREARISEIRINAPNADTFDTEVSTRILELDSLRYLSIRGASITGSLPRRKDCKSALTDLQIYSTRIKYIPDEVFQYPNLKRVLIQENHKLMLPEGVLKRKIFEGDFDRNYPLRFWIKDNGFSGSFPLITNHIIVLDGNNITSLNWDGMKEKDFKKHFKSEISPSPLLWNNRITGKVPDYVLADTLAILYVDKVVGTQQPGYGLENMPSDEEIQKMKEEYKKNHPEEVKDYRFF